MSTPVKVFAALADETRWSVLVRVGESPASASALAKELPISRQAIMKHLELLAENGLVIAAREGREIVYRALGAPLNDTARQLERIASRWEGQLQRIKSAAEQAERTHA